jgi:hypothetical protein
MNKLKKIALIGAVVLVVSATSITALAASSYNNPAEIVAGLTGKSVESVTAEKTETDVTYGALAGEYGVLDQFKSQMLEQKKAYLAERVAAGTMTQERADAIIAAMEANQANCDGTCIGGAGYGMGNGACDGNCDGIGVGAGGSNGGMNGNHGGGGRNGSGCGSGFCAGNAQS